MAWIKIDRQITDHWIWSDPIKLKWWLDIIMFVNFEDKKVLIGNELYDCKRGQSMLSLKSWGERWNVSKDTVRNFFYLLERDHMIAHENCTKTTRITVCNYDTYQGDLHAKQTQSKRKPNATPTQLKKEEELSKDNYICQTKFEKYEKWVKTNCPNVSKLEIQMTEENFNVLTSKYDSQFITDKLLAMENKKDLVKKYKSVYLTLNAWLKMK
jgi:hypothetical protein